MGSLEGEYGSTLLVNSDLSLMASGVSTSHTLALFDAHEMVCVEGAAFGKVYDPHSHSSYKLV